MFRLKALTGPAIGLALAFGLVSNAAASTLEADYGSSLSPGDVWDISAKTGISSGTFSYAYTFDLDEASVGEASLTAFTSSGVSKISLEFATGTSSGGTFTKNSDLGSVDGSTLFPGMLAAYIQKSLLNTGETFALIVSGTSSGNGSFDPYLQLTAVPIPAAAWLFGSSLMGVMWIGRRRRAQSAA